MSELQTTVPNRPWLVKMALFIALLLGFGVWGYYDATVKYPARGENAAEYRLLEYLNTAERLNRLRYSDLIVSDPHAELDRLRARAQAGELTELERTRMEWLESLAVIGKLNEEEVRTRLTESPREARSALSAAWASRTPPEPLAWFDLPVQWAITVIGIAGGALVLAHTLRVVSRKYRWDTAGKKLILPGGAEITPDDLDDVDKRKWHKFIVFLNVRPEHPSLGGRSVKLDLYQYAPLEDWVLEMERTAFPERAQEEEPAEPPAPEQAAAGES